MIVEYLKERDLKNVWIQSENGVLGLTRVSEKDELDLDLINAGKEVMGLRKGGCYFGSSESFGMIRAGKVF